MAIQFISRRFLFIQAMRFSPAQYVFPEINEDDIREQVTSGSGPGGQKVNKAQNCVILKHHPTGIVVRCHESRMLHENRTKARKLLTLKLDDMINGDNSYSAQRKAKFDKQKANNRRKSVESQRQRREYKLLYDEYYKNDP